MEVNESGFRHSNVLIQTGSGTDLMERLANTDNSFRGVLLLGKELMEIGLGWGTD